MLSFLGIGSQKAGTTWLYSMLLHHPQIAFPGGKEIHYWDQPDGRDVALYRSIFAILPISGDFTPAYQILPVPVIQQIYSEFPELQLILLIRNPVDRAWSSAKMVLRRAQMTLPEASDNWFLDHFHSNASRMRGDYESAIRNWRQVYPPEKLLIRRFEDITSEPRSLLISVAKHLGVDTLPFAELPDAVLQERIFTTEAAPIRPALRPVLNALYFEKILSLQDYLETDLSDWLTDNAAAL